jgi:hypothetical protein
MGEAERAEFEKYFVGDIAFKLTSSAVVSPVKYELKIKDSVAYITYYWTQKFPAGKIITVSHEYIPAGGLDTPDKDDDWNGFWKRNYVDLYCIEPKLNQWVLQYRKWAVPVHYILTTGANWKAPIGHFKLTIKKETPEQKVSLCVDNIKKIDDMTFQLENNNFLPDSDLNVLFIDTPIDVEIKN